jgi:hypothetical protein
LCSGLILPILFLSAVVGRGQDDPGAQRPPVVGRPEQFDEDESPIGAFQPPVVEATPRDLQAEDSLTFTLRIKSAGPVQRPPRRFLLEKQPGFTDRFYIEYPNGPVFRSVDSGGWELRCTLKPKSVEVKEVPSLSFVYFTPGLLPPQRGYQIQRTSSIPLTVRPRTAVEVPEVRAGIDWSAAPESVYQFEHGPAVVRRPHQWSWQGLLALGTLGLLLPPVACVGWCIAWRLRHPDEARRARRRRSRAATEALSRLRGAKGSEGNEQIAAIIADYLRDRFDLAAEDPTPAEVEAPLIAAGRDAKLVRAAGALFQACDAARFAGEKVDPADVRAAAERLIADLEGEP